MELFKKILESSCKDMSIWALLSFLQDDWSTWSIMFVNKLLKFSAKTDLSVIALLSIIT